MAQNPVQMAWLGAIGYAAVTVASLGRPILIMWDALPGRARSDPRLVIRGRIATIVFLLVAVVVTPTCDEPVGLSLQRIEQRRLHPIAGVQDDVGARHLVPYPVRQVARPLRDVGVGDQ